jgi:hypothetical protein
VARRLSDDRLRQYSTTGEDGKRGGRLRVRGPRTELRRDEAGARWPPGRDGSRGRASLRSPNRPIETVTERRYERTRVVRNVTYLDNVSIPITRLEIS